MNDDLNDAVHQEQPTTAVSIFDEAGAAGDFPVLKAFQQYIDAEQAKARKRMIWLSAFFVTLLVIVVVVFSLIMSTIISRDQQNLSAIATRNQELSDKLLDIALKKQEPVVIPQPQQPPASDGALKPVLEKLENLATAMARPQQQAPAPSQESTLKPVLEKLENLATAITSRPQPSPVQQPVVVPVQSAPVYSAAAEQEASRLREDLRKLQEEMQAEKAQALKAEKERKRQEEVERHRRRLYPEYYAREDARKAADAAAMARRAPAPLPAEKAPSASTKQPAPAIRPEPEIPARQPTRPAPPKPAVSGVAEPSPKPVAALPKDKPISYFEENDEELKGLVRESAERTGSSKAETKANKTPSAENGTATTNAVAAKAPSTQAVGSGESRGTVSTKKPEVLNVGAKEGESIPFLIELPEAK